MFSLANTSNYSTILVDSITNQLRYLAPTHQFQNWGPNQNPYSSLSNMISQVNSCNVMTLKNTFVGIGTTNPLTRLYVVQAASNAITVDGNNNTTGITVVANSTQCNVGVSLIHDLGSNAYLLNKSGNIYIRNGYANQGIFIDRFNNVTVGGNVNTSNLFSVIGGGVSIGYSNADKAQLHSMIVAGSVSIGTLSSTNRLNVNGSASITSNVAFGSIFTTASNVGINTTAVQNALTVAGGVAIGAYSNVTGPALGAIISGNVAIGTTSTVNALNVSGGVGIGTYVNNTAPNNGLIVSGNVGIGTLFNGNMLSVAGTTVIGSYARNGNIITNSDSLIVSGNIGIGSTDPKYSLDIRGSAVIGNITGNLTASTNGLSVYGNVGIGSQLSSIPNLLTLGGNASIGYSTPPNAPNNGLLVSGNVGLGHPSGNLPGNILDIYGSVAIGSGFYGFQSQSPDSLIVSGNVGIGITNPRSRLHVIGTSLIGIGDTTTTSNMVIGQTLNVSGTSTLTTTNIQNTSVNNILTPALNVSQNTGAIGNVADFFDTTVSASTPIVRIGNNSTVSIGGTVTNPGSYKLNVNGSVNSSLATNTNLVTSNTGIFGYGSSYPAPAANGVLIYGRTGIGSQTGTVPQNMLDVNGSVGIGTYYGSAAPANSLIVSGNVGVGTNNPSNKLQVHGPVNIGIGDTTTVNNLNVTGNINVTGLTTIANTIVTETDSFSICNYIVNTPTTPALRVRQNTGNIGSIADFIDITNNLSSTIATLRVDYGGRVGIGTNGTANAYSLTVNGQTITNTLLNTANARIGFATNITATAPVNGLLVNSKVGVGSTDQPANILGVNGNMTVGTAYYAQTGIPSDSLIVSGNVGINTAFPSARLHVIGTSLIGIGDTTTTSNMVVGQNLNVGGTVNVNSMVTMSNVTVVNNTQNTNTPALTIRQNTGGNGIVADFYDTFGSANIPVLRIKGYNNVTTSNTVIIGDGASSGYNLIVNGTITALSGLSSGSGGTGTLSGTVPASSLTGTGILPIIVMPTVLNSTGQNTANPSQGATTFYSIPPIGTTLNASTSNGSYPIITVDQYGRVTNTSTQSITSSQWIGPGANTPLIYFNGIVGIGTSSDTSNTFSTAPGTSTSCYLYVDGDIYAAGDIIGLSDEKYKKDLKRIENPIEKIKQVSGYTYTRIDTGNRQTGVIAQELEKVLPEAVQTDGNGDKSVAYGNVIGLLIECIKDQQKQIDELRALVK